MNIVEAINSKPGKIKRKLINGLTEVKEFYNNGQILEHYFEDGNGKLHGEYKSWWSNGTLSAHCYFENGKLHGEYKRWWENGTLWEHSEYKNGEKIKDYLKEK